MKYSIKFEVPPVGHVTEYHAESHTVTVMSREFISSEDGDQFIQRLEGFPGKILEMLPDGARTVPANISTMVVTIEKDGSADVYINDPSIRSVVSLKQPHSASPGAPVFQDDILNVERVALGDIEVKNHQGFLIYFYVSWRRALFYDLEPLASGGQSLRTYDMEAMLGAYHTYLHFQDVFRVNQSEWETLIAQRWFPFRALPTELVKSMIAVIREGRDIDEMLSDIHSQVSRLIDDMLARWSLSPVVGDSLEILRNSVERFKADDYVSSSSIIYPRIEGVMRQLHGQSATTNRPNFRSFIRSTVSFDGHSERMYSTLIPKRFLEYLENVIFASFQPGVAAPASRHSIAHGVVSPNDLDLKAAMLGILAFDQVCLFAGGATGAALGTAVGWRMMQG